MLTLIIPHMTYKRGVIPKKLSMEHLVVEVLLKSDVPSVASALQLQLIFVVPRDVPSGCVTVWNTYCYIRWPSAYYYYNLSFGKTNTHADFRIRHTFPQKKLRVR